jgi:hypothetical protein
LVLFQEGVEGLIGRLASLGHPDVMEVVLGFGLNALGHLVEDVGCLVNPAFLFMGFTKNFTKCRAESRFGSPKMRN